MMFLIENGADINKFDPDEGGKGALEFAFEVHDKAKFQLLINHGARLDLPDWINRTLKNDMLARGYKSIDDIPDEYWDLKLPIIRKGETFDSYRARLHQFIDSTGY